MLTATEHQRLIKGGENNDAEIYDPAYSSLL